MPIFLTLKLTSDSYPSLGAILLSRKGRKKAINTEEAACSPIELENISTPSPMKKEKRINSPPGISTGSRIMKSTYI